MNPREFPSLPPLLLIGQFSRLSGLSCRMLRFYAEQHILVPAYTDPETGYRRYLSSQLGEARFLLRLRKADFSVEDIRSIMGDMGKKERAGLGKEQRKSLENKIQALEDALDELGVLEKEWGTPRYGLLRTEPLRVYSTFFRGERKTLRECARNTMGQFLESLPEPLSGSPFLCSYSLKKGPEDAALHIPGNENSTEILPGGLAAAVLHRGAYQNLPKTLEGLLGWVRCQNYVPQGTVREWYFPNGEEDTAYGEVELSLPLIEE